MATGIQTGMRSRSARPAVSDTSAENLLGKISKQLGKLSSTVRKVIILTLTVLGVLSISLGYSRYQNPQVDLFPNKLTETEVRDVEAVLTEVGINYNLAPTKDGFKVAKVDQAKARVCLASRSIPKRAILTPDRVEPNWKMTSAERKMLQQQLLEGELTQTLRGIDGIQDATVKLALPEQHQYWADASPNKASVTLTVSSDARFSPATIKGIQNMVAYSVPELAPQNVQIMDNHGKTLTRQNASSEAKATELAADNFELTRQQEREKKNELQQTLEAMFPGRTQVILSLELDFSQLEERHNNPGPVGTLEPVIASEQHKSEAYDGKEKEKGKSYSVNVDSVNYKTGENQSIKVTKAPRISNISAVVFADGFSAKEAESLKESVENALGVRYERGDKVSIDTTPWDHKEIFSPDKPALTDNTLAIYKAENPLPAPAATFALLMCGLSFMGLALALNRLAKRSKDEYQPITMTEPTPLASIIDQLRQKDGRSTNYGKTAKTRANTTELLEGVIKEKPAQVADLLRSTWLS